jgi:flagellar biosynthesis anti-sigma factor FlgM
MNPIKLNSGGEVEAYRTAVRPEVERTPEETVSQQKANAAVSPIADSVNVSDLGAAIGELSTRVEQLPSVRQERIQELRAQVEDGIYRPPAGEIADAILKETRS